MTELLFNEDNLKQEEIDITEIRVKALIINSKKQILLGYSYKTYQFPGGHIEKGENYEDCLIRELQEETGLVFDSIDIKRFLKINTYIKNYLDSGNNHENVVYYYEIKTDNYPNLENMDLDNQEREGDFKLVYVRSEDFEKLLTESIPDNPVNKGIVKEMITAYNYYLERG